MVLFLISRLSIEPVARPYETPPSETKRARSATAIDGDGGRGLNRDIREKPPSEPGRRPLKHERRSAGAALGVGPERVVLQRACPAGERPLGRRAGFGAARFGGVAPYPQIVVESRHT